MLNLSDVYSELFDLGAVVFQQKKLLPCNADAMVIIAGNAYGVFIDRNKVQTSSEELVCLAHEWAHITTGATYALGATDAVRQKAEIRASRAEIKKLLPFNEMAAAMQRGYSNEYRLAEYFGVTEDFIRQAYVYYTEACGYQFEIPG